MNKKDIDAFFNKIMPELSKENYSKLLEIYTKLAAENTELRRKNKTLQEEIRKLKNK